MDNIISLNETVLTVETETNENENTFVCDYCGAVHPINESTETANGDNICETCNSDYHFTCDSCGEVHHIDNRIITTHGDAICENCYSDDYFTCDCCGEVFHMDYYEQDGYCRHCYEEEEEEEENTINEYHKNKPSLRFFDSQQNYKNIGIELEIDRKTEIENYEKNENAEHVKNLLPDGFIYFENDSSVSNGFENITMPSSLNFIQNLEWDKVFEYYKENGYIAHDAKNAGIHINIDRRFFSDLRLERLLLIFKYFDKEILKFSRRTAEQLEKYCQYYDFERFSVEEIIKEKQQNEKFRAVNLTKSNVIEIRIFRSTLNLESFKSILYFIENVLNLVENDNFNNFLFDIDGMLIENNFENLFINNEVLKSYWDRVKNR